MNRTLTLSICLLVLVICGGATTAHARPTELHLQILPLECVADVIYDGVNRISRLYPKECSKPPTGETRGDGNEKARRGIPLQNGNVYPTEANFLSSGSKDNVLQNSFEPTASGAVTGRPVIAVTQHIGTVLIAAGVTASIIIFDMFLFEARLSRKGVQAARGIKRRIKP